MSRRLFVLLMEEPMSQETDTIRLEDGTLIRHKMMGYEGRIDGTTAIKDCFTSGGTSLHKPGTKETFQYRVAVSGESIRRIAPAEDLEILEPILQIVCSRCNFAFQSKHAAENKPAGRCPCGSWICPACLACNDTRLCPHERKRLLRKLNKNNKVRAG
jgi:hypothetical protein